ncbi:MAG: hypothetical protein Q8R67_15060 [Rhodoferax sp.]|nr:hypothetical protein [Rhodoferax sp.]MDP3652996.1 hypothetical protein [Rhodoferax sp.]
MKTKHTYPCPMCDGRETRTLSDEAAVEIHEFLAVIAANFLSRYGQRIYRHYDKRAKRNLNPDKPWCNSDDSF